MSNPGPGHEYFGHRAPPDYRSEPSGAAWARATRTYSSTISRLRYEAGRTASRRAARKISPFSRRRSARPRRTGQIVKALVSEMRSLAHSTRWRALKVYAWALDVNAFRHAVAPWSGEAAVPTPRCSSPLAVAHGRDRACSVTPQAGTRAVTDNHRSTSHDRTCRLLLARILVALRWPGGSYFGSLRKAPPAMRGVLKDAWIRPGASGLCGPLLR